MDEKINNVVRPATNFIESIVFVSFDFTVGGQPIGVPIVLVLLVAGALFFTVYFRFVNIRKFGLAINIVRGKYSDPNEAGEVSHFQALTAALSGTVGLGNIAGVAVAISLGGPGATFWMVFAGLLGMSSKFVECTLGVKYREVDKNGTVYGGPMYYLSKGFSEIKRVVAGEEKDYSKVGKVLAVIFAIAAVGGSFGGGNMFQVNQAFQQFAGLEFMQGSYLANNGWAFGLIMAVLVAIVIIGGIKSIAKVTDKIVPLMCGIYVLAALVVIFAHAGQIPAAFSAIFKGAFAPTAIAGGFVGVLIQGFRRAAFSNEAGIGSASIAHSAVKTNNPASEGLVALLEPFIDTVIVCTMTALVIVITGKYVDSSVSDGIALTSSAFETVLPWFKYILAGAVLLFAFSTMITWSYYGQQAWTYLFGRGKVKEYVYKLIFCTMVVVGSAASLDAVIGFSDAMIFTMLFPNIVGLIFLAPVVKSELNKYLAKIKSGEIQRVK
jgi:AGCS family alanine or glycine:cation symporter